MEHFWIDAAGLPAEITAQHPLTRRLCRDYEIAPPQSPAVLTACAEPETAMRLADGAASPAYLEFLCIHDSLAAQLPAHHRFLMHGAAIAFDGAAYLFTAPSGTGKTTHVRLWRQYLGSRVTVVNGDKPFLSLEPDGTVRVWGSPWAGKERWQSPISVPLCGVCLLERGTDRICLLPPEQALTPLFRQTYHRDDPALEYLTLGFLDALLRRVPVYRLTCGMTDNAVRCSFEALTGLPYENYRRPDGCGEEGSAL